MTPDHHLQKTVQDELSWEPSVVSAHIGVTAADGVVTLTGHVANYSQKHAAEVAALRVKGVNAVAEHIEVRLPYGAERSDEDIAAAAVDRIGWDTAMIKDAIKVQVENGWVTLSGQVEWNYQKENAGNELRHLLGVVGLSNNITIRPRVDVDTITDDITHALHRSWLFAPKTVTVSAKGGVVHLSGSVHLPYDKQLAAATAWSARGVTGVQNDIAVV